MRFAVPPQVLAALRKLDCGGHEACLVGGCVRDALMDREPIDYDIATSALPDEVKTVFRGERVLDTGLRHGTLTLLMNGLSMEVTTFRSDGPYSDGRHPDGVSFTASLEEDLNRRDFTINAMAWHPKRGLMDPQGGEQDLEHKIIRAVGEPDKRFREDALRILRALRFACQLGFGIQERTLQGMMDEGPGLRRVSAERVAGELNLALTGEFAGPSLRAYPKALTLALPELAPLTENAKSLWEITLRTLEMTPPEPALRWAALLRHTGESEGSQDDGKAQGSEQLVLDILNRLRQPKRLILETAALVRHQAEALDMDSLRPLLYRLGPHTLRGLLLLRRAGALAGHPGIHPGARELDALLEQSERLVRDGACLNLRGLAVSGEDLLTLGYRKDRHLGEALDRLLWLVLRGEADNERSILLRKAEEMLRSESPET